MGCCVSTHGTSTKHQNFQVGSESLKPKSSHESRAPPPLIEEETVKEVLSETPKLKPPPVVTQLIQPIKNPQQELHYQETNKNNILVDPPFPDEKIKTNGHKEEAFIVQEEEISEKEVCSLSFSETVSTTTFNYDKRDDDDDDDGEEVKQRVMKSPVTKLTPRNRAVSGNFGPTRDRSVGKSPNRRTDQSPDKRNNASRGGGGGGSMRLVQSRESSTNQAGRRGLKPDENRRDPGESSGRRSRSPANNGSTVGRSPSTRRTNGSPCRSRTDLTQSGGMEGKWPCTSNGSRTTTDESLENPLVSLECFIFL